MEDCFYCCHYSSSSVYYTAEIGLELDFGNLSFNVKAIQMIHDLI